MTYFFFCLLLKALETSLEKENEAHIIYLGYLGVGWLCGSHYPSLGPFNWSCWWTHGLCLRKLLTLNYLWSARGTHCSLIYCIVLETNSKACSCGLCTVVHTHFYTVYICMLSSQHVVSRGGYVCYWDTCFQCKAVCLSFRFRHVCWFDCLGDQEACIGLRLSLALQCYYTNCLFATIYYDPLHIHIYKLSEVLNNKRTFSSFGYVSSDLEIIFKRNVSHCKVSRVLKDPVITLKIPQTQFESLGSKQLDCIVCYISVFYIMFVWLGLCCICFYGREAQLSLYRLC